MAWNLFAFIFKSCFLDLKSIFRIFQGLFTVQLSMFVCCFQQLWYLSTSLSLCQQLFYFLFCEALCSRNQLDYIITTSVLCQQLFSTFLNLFEHAWRSVIDESSKRRRRDLNPRAAINDLHPFQGCPFGQLGYFSEYVLHIILYHRNQSDKLAVGYRWAERMGFEPMRPFGQTVFKTASLWPLRYLSMLSAPIPQRR